MEARAERDEYMTKSVWRLDRVTIREPKGIFGQQEREVAFVHGEGGQFQAQGQPRRKDRGVASKKSKDSHDKKGS